MISPCQPLEQPRDIKEVGKTFFIARICPLLFFVQLQKALYFSGSSREVRRKFSKESASFRHRVPCQTDVKTRSKCSVLQLCLIKFPIKKILQQTQLSSTMLDHIIRRRRRSESHLYVVAVRRKTQLLTHSCLSSGSSSGRKLILVICDTVVEHSTQQSKKVRRKMSSVNDSVHQRTHTSC